VEVVVCAPRNRSLSGSGEAEDLGEVEEEVMVWVAEPVVGVAVPERFWARVWVRGWRLG
jgi:hypothetical protein